MKRNLIIVALIFLYPFVMAGSAVVGQANCPEQTVEIKAPPCEVAVTAEPCECNCIIDLRHVGVPQPPVCPEVKIVPVEPAHFVGPVAGYSSGWLLGAGWTMAKPKWALEANAGIRWYDQLTAKGGGVLWDGDYPPHRWAQSVTERTEDEPFVTVAWKWRIDRADR